MSSARRRALFVISAADTWVLSDGTRHPTGYWAEEVAEPHRLFTAEGWHITIATPDGRAPTLDRLSLGISGGTPWKRRRIARYLTGIAEALATPVALAAIDHSDYDLVFYPGGHGPMVDLAFDAVSGALLTARLNSGKPLALLCHGPAAILATGTDGASPFVGYRVTALSDREELLNRFARKAPWLLEDALKRFGVDYAKRRIPLAPFVVQDRNLFTGQNPGSAARLANRLVAELGPPVIDISVSAVVAAPRDRVHAFVADMPHMGELSPENSSTRWLVPGHRFVGRNRIGPFYRWSMTGTVTENVPGESFGFLTDSPSESHWRYTFADATGGTTVVTETMRKYTRQIRPVVFLQDISGARDRRAHLEAGMTATLANLAERFAPPGRPPTTLTTDDERPS